MFLLGFFLFAVLPCYAGLRPGEGMINSLDVRAEGGYCDGRPRARLRLEAKDYGIVLRHGDGPDKCDIYGARDVWVFEADGTYYMHYDAAGPTGWLCSLATSEDIIHWKKKGPILDLGKSGEDDSKGACYGVTYFDGKEWHMFYLGTPNTTPPPDRVPWVPYLIMKAKGISPAGPWVKQKKITPFRPKPGTYYSVTASPGCIVKHKGEYLQFFSAAVEDEDIIKRTLGIARTKDLDGQWIVDPSPIVPLEEQIENSSLYYEESNKTWFLFTNHIGIDDIEYTDAIWVYWSKDLNKWDPKNKAVVLDGQNCKWSKRIIGLPSVLKVGTKLAIFYDGLKGSSVPPGAKSHMRRDIGLAWLGLPLVSPARQGGACRSTANLIPTYLRCEYRVNPLGIDVLKPRLSWILESGERGQKQTAYRILVASSEENLKHNKGDLWDSGKVESDQSIHIEYCGKELKSCMRCYWKVMVWDKDGKPSAYSSATGSRPAMWSMGLLKPLDWKGHWITIGKSAIRVAGKMQNEQSAPMLRREFIINKEIKEACVYVCGLGYYELNINGTKIGDHVLDPAQTDYEQRALYVVYDVTGNLKKGPNAIGVILGNGWYCQSRVWGGLSYGKPRLLLQLNITHTDGTRKSIVTNETWKAATGPILANNIYAGESYDARLEHPGWSTGGFDDCDWDNAQLIAGPGGSSRCAAAGRLVSQKLPPVRRMKVIKPVSMASPKPGVYVYDMGQNFAGWARLKVAAKAGTKITLRFAEIVDPNGMIDPASTGVFATGVVQTDAYICKGGPDKSGEVWEPRFTYHGFRYVEMTGFPGEPGLDSLEGIVVYSSVETVGRFTCSNELINRIHRTNLWTRISALHGIPNDCPHRERCGWLGDAHVTAEMMILNWDVAQFLTKYMGDIKTSASKEYETTKYGAHFHDTKIGIKKSGIPTMAAPGKRTCGEASPDWGSAIVQLPWYLYLYYGDERILHEYYQSMKQWVEHLRSLARDGIVSNGLGDWCPPGWKLECPIALSSTAYYYLDTRILADAAALLGKTEDAVHYGKLANDIRAAFINNFLDKEQMTYGSQTADTLALYLGLLPEGKELAIAQSLARNVVEKHDGHSSCGIHGHRHLYWALSNYACDDVAFGILTQTSYPSFADAFQRGATTLWEYWPPTGMGKEGRISLNHPMHGGFDAWFYYGVAGINPTPKSPGFKHIILRPNLVNQLKFASASYRSMYGTIESAWQNKDGTFQWHIVIPPNTTATVYVPAKDAKSVTEAGQPAAEAEGVKFLRMEVGTAVYEVGSGSYLFVAKDP